MIILKIAASLALFYGFGYLSILCMEKGDKGSERNFLVWAGHFLVVFMLGLGSIIMVWSSSVIMPDVDWRSVMMFIGGAIYLAVVGVAALAEQIDDECES